MKEQILKTVIGAVSGILVLLVLTQIWVAAQVDNGMRLVGSWDVTITPRDCETGAPAPFPPAFSAVQTYNQGGTMLVGAPGGPGTTILEGHGIWKHEKAQSYSISFRFLQYAPDGTYIGMNVVRDVVTLDSGGDTYTSTGAVYNVQPDGTSVILGCATTAGTRFQ